MIATKVYVTETELKFQVPDGRRDAVAAALRRGRVRQLRLVAFYVDTPDRKLAAAGIALRLRREGRRWVQTLKGRGHGMFSRFEHELPVAAPAAGAIPDIDLNRFAGTPAGDALAAALGEDGTALQVIFTTDVRRTLRLMKSGASVIEVALDEGFLQAGEVSRSLCELEFELKSGTLGDLLALARRWVPRFELWLDVRTKADRGDQLARNQPYGPVVFAGDGAVPLEKSIQVDAALRRMVAACLAHLLPNAAELARGTAVAEHLHQARVALRRLRTALQGFADAGTAAESAWNEQLKALFDPLGAARDRDALQAWLLPALQAAGLPAPQLPALAIDGVDPGAAFRTAAANDLMLQLIRYARGSPDAASPVLRPLAAQRLRGQQRRLREDADAFAGMHGAERHAVRKRLKRFRYSVELTAALWSPKVVGGLLAAVRPAQQRLGQLNDLAVAQQLFTTRDPMTAGDWFARGWLAATIDASLPAAGRALAVLAGTRGGWRKHRHPA